MGRVNFKSNKHQKELARKLKKEQKKQRKIAKNNMGSENNETPCQDEKES
jgi:hypothetical protein